MDNKKELAYTKLKCLAEMIMIDYQLQGWSVEPKKAVGTTREMSKHIGFAIAAKDALDCAKLSEGSK